jgi:hypothetical protein
MTKEGIPIIARAAEVNEVMATPPRWILKWGSTFVALVFFILGYLAYTIKYPDTIRFQVILKCDPVNPLKATCNLEETNNVIPSSAQRINLKLDKYPFQTFGVISGKMTSIQRLRNGYHVAITLDSLKTSFNKSVVPDSNMSGSLEIYTEERSILERLLSKER